MWARARPGGFRSLLHGRLRRPWDEPVRPRIEADTVRTSGAAPRVVENDRLLLEKKDAGRHAGGLALPARPSLQAHPARHTSCPGRFVPHTTRTRPTATTEDY